MNVLILYYTKTGHTLEAANAAAQGIRSAGAEVDLVAVADLSAADLENYDALIVASPCWGGSLTPMGVALPLFKALSDLPADALRGKRGGAIAVHYKYGALTTVRTIGQMLEKKGCDDVRLGPVAQAGVPFSVWVGPAVSPEDQARFAAFGAEFVA